MAEIKVIEGDFTQCSGRYALVVGRFNGFVVESLVEGALDTLRRHGIANDDITVVRVPGAYEMPLAVKRVAETGNHALASIGNELAAKLYGREGLARDIEDHPENETRFVAVGGGTIPAPTGHDKTSIVVFQRQDGPGSLLSILQQFSARSINLTNLQSRPTKKGLGDYCFLIDLEGHVGDDVVADCLKILRAKGHEVKFLGSYPSAVGDGPAVRREAGDASAAADQWMAAIRRRIATPGS